MKTKKNITIKDLYIDSTGLDELEERAVLLALHGKISFTPKNEIVFIIDISKLKAKTVILLYALGKKLLKAKGKIDDEVITRSEITDKTGLKDNTVGVTIKRLKDKKIFIRSDSGYKIPAFKLSEVLAIIKDNYKE